MSPRPLLATALVVLTTASNLLGVGPAPVESAQMFVPARGVAGSSIGPKTVVATRHYPAGARLVEASVIARQIPGTKRRATMVSVELVCGKESVQATTNVVTSVTLRPRRIMQDPTSCTIVATSAVTKATAKDGVRVTTAMSARAVTWSATGYRPAGWPDLVRTGARLDAAAVKADVPETVPVLRVAGDLKVTSCTSVGGSRENGSPYLCQAKRLNSKGSRIAASIVVQQLDADGKVCAQRTITGPDVMISAITHHGMISRQGTYAMSTAEKCTRTVRVSLATRVVSGADIVVHRKGTMTSVYAVQI